MKLLFVVVLSCFSFSMAHAQSQCAHIFATSNGGGGDKESYTLTRELRLKPEAVEYLVSTRHKPLIESLSHIFENLNGFTYFYLPLVIKNSAALKSHELMSPRRQDAGAWEFDTTSEAFRRAYTALKKVTPEELERVSGEPISWALAEADLILLAHLTAKVVPTNQVESVSVTERSSIEINKRIIEMASDRRFIPIIHHLLSNGIEMSYLNSRFQEFAYQMEQQANVRYDSFEQIQRLTEKLASGRSLGKQETATLSLVFYKIFMVTVDNSGFMGGTIRNGHATVTRQEFLRQLNKTLDTYLQGRNFSRMYALDALTYVFLGERPAPYGDPFLQVINTAANLLLLPAKNEYSHVKAELTQAQQRTVSAPVLTDFTPVPVTKDPFAPQPTKTREKTRGKADERAVESAPVVEDGTVRSIEHLIEIGPVQWGIALEANVVYKVQFERDFGQFRGPQDFIFKEDVVNWLQEHPTVAAEFFDAIKMGVSQQGTSHSGVKILRQIPRTFDGRLYEVKIKDKYRLVLVHNGGEWQVVMVSEKDHFDNDIRHL